MMFWNGEFVRGLAQGILDRARVIRSGLSPVKKASKRKSAASKKTVAPKAGRRKRRG